MFCVYIIEIWYLVDFSHLYTHLERKNNNIIEHFMLLQNLYHIGISYSYNCHNNTYSIICKIILLIVLMNTVWLWSLVVIRNNYDNNKIYNCQSSGVAYKNTSYSVFGTLIMNVQMKVSSL